MSPSTAGKVITVSCVLVRRKIIYKQMDVPPGEDRSMNEQLEGKGDTEHGKYLTNGNEAPQPFGTERPQLRLTGEQEVRGQQWLPSYPPYV